MHLPEVFLLLLACSSALASECTPEVFSNILAHNEAASVSYAGTVAKGGSFGIPSLAYPANATNLPALCAVTICVKSSANSSFSFGLFLPDTTWNERFLATGNGGSGGGINWPDMGTFSQYGFATMSTDTGHNSTVIDSSWALNAPDAIIDWGWRAMHGSVMVAKSVIDAYYDDFSAIKYSYYASCSTGGRQGMKEIQLYPDSFDGVVIGAPSWWTTHISPMTLKQGLYNYPNSSSKYIGIDLFPAILKEITKQCDPQDGVIDGIISDPSRCNFNYESLLCTPASRAACLNPAQLTTIKQFYSDYVDVNQTFVYPAISLGGDPTLLLAGLGSAFGYQYFKYQIYNDTKWDFTQFSYADVQKADELDPGQATADDFDLSPFKQQGGKLLMYHGTADNLVPTGGSIYYYNQVYQALAPKGVNLDDFFRFFLIPGMSHCLGSAVAPWYIGASSQVPSGTTHSVPGFMDANHDIILAMMRWVEEGRAPNQLIATKFNERPRVEVGNHELTCLSQETSKAALRSLKSFFEYEIRKEMDKLKRPAEEQKKADQYTKARRLFWAAA
ncbi:feruloyl esterase B precursor [Pseudomassariella vexata]|uniref:Carboxylic ester hydrolase n=1 Tax=Pseudomassariella vexata TaxID=1141098 RepID=A0A1Y2EIC6_9PEZI|nr:feruloyl esterase B precursor [Pseudomassariella vexata]ORY71320.1 feruloyl esterase B precursor [Pseudomassariella vexata]